MSLLTNRWHLGIALLAVAQSPLATAGDEFNVELRLEWDATRASSTTSLLTIGDPLPLVPPEITVDSDTDRFSLTGSWYFGGASAAEGPLVRAPFVSRASSVSFGYARNETETIIDINPEPSIVPSPGLPAPVLPPPDIGGIVLVPVTSIDNPGLDGDSVTLGGRYVWKESGWFVFGRATVDEASVDNGPVLDVDAHQYVAGTGLYVGRLTTIDIVVIRNEREVRTGVDRFDDSDTDVALGVSHLGALGTRWQYGVDVAVSSAERRGADDGTALIRGSLYPRRQLAFGVEVDTTFDELLGDQTRYRLFASWFMTPGLELAGSVGRAELDGIPGTSFFPGASLDEDFFSVRILGRF